MNPTAQFTLTGFKQQGEFRVFTFENAGAKVIRTEYVVRADITLIRKYDIQLQELPLLCRSLLEGPDGPGETRSFTYTEEEMRAHSTNIATAKREAAQRKKPPRRPANTNLGAAWRDERGMTVPMQILPTR